jgi:hypothetical protein
VLRGRWDATPSLNRSEYAGEVGVLEQLAASDRI